MTGPVAFKYRAFLSYAHADMGWARWMQRRLEAYALDKDLRGRVTALGPVPPKLAPIFRDRDDFSGGTSLNDATIAALDASAALIVLCSTVSATRPAVNEEVRLFRHRHPDRPVIPVIVAGQFPANFPQPLRFELAADGSVTDREITILGPDLRERGDGRGLGLAKVIAGLTGVAADEVYRRAQRSRQRSLRRSVAGLALIAAALAGLAGWAEINRRDAVAQRAVAEERRQVAEQNFAAAKQGADALVFDIAQVLRNQKGIRTETVRKILGTAEQVFDKLVVNAGGDKDLQRSQSVMLDEFATTYDDQGDTPKEDEVSRKSLAIMENLTATEPNNTGWQSDLSIAQNRVGDVLVVEGKFAEALRYYNDAFSVMEKLDKLAPGTAKVQENLSISDEKIGYVYQVTGDLPAALKRYQDSMQRMDLNRDHDPSNKAYQHAKSLTLNKIGLVILAQGDLPGALKDFQDGLAIMKALTDSDPGNTQWQTDLAVSYLQVGGALSIQGKTTEALEAFKSSNEVAESLANSDPDNGTWQHNLSISDQTYGMMLLNNGDTTDALKMYKDGLVIANKLVASDPGNTDWLRLQCLSHVNVATAAIKAGDKTTAGTELGLARQINTQLSSLAPNNTQWQLDRVLIDKQQMALGQ